MGLGVLDAPWQGCTVHFVRNMHGHCRPAQRGLVSAALREVFNATHRDEARRRMLLDSSSNLRATCADCNLSRRD